MANTALKRSLNASALLSTRQFFTTKAEHRAADVAGERGGPGSGGIRLDLQIQLGGNAYTAVGRQALDEAIVRHGGTMWVSHPDPDAGDPDVLFVTEEHIVTEEHMNTALDMEARIASLSRGRNGTCTDCNLNAKLVRVESCVEKCRDIGEFPLKSVDFVLKNGQSFCNSR